MDTPQIFFGNNGTWGRHKYAPWDKGKSILINHPLNGERKERRPGGLTTWAPRNLKQLDFFLSPHFLLLHTYLFHHQLKIIWFQQPWPWWPLPFSLVLLSASSPNFSPNLITPSCHKTPIFNQKFWKVWKGGGGFFPLATLNHLPEFSSWMASCLRCGHTSQSHQDYTRK